MVGPTLHCRQHIFNTRRWHRCGSRETAQLGCDSWRIFGVRGLRIGVLQTHVRVSSAAKRLTPYHICYICAPKYATPTVAEAVAHECVAPVAQARDTWRPTGDYSYPPYVTTPLQNRRRPDITHMQLRSRCADMGRAPSGLETWAQRRAGIPTRL